MDMLNYSAQAIEAFLAFRDGAKRFNYDTDAKLIEWLCDAISHSQKFRLPDGGRLLDPQRTVGKEDAQKIADLYRLPFPETLIEYSVTENISWLRDNLNNEGIGRSTKRMALAIDSNSSFLAKMPAPEENKRAMERVSSATPGAFIFSLFTVDSGDGRQNWNVPATMMFYPYGGGVAKPDFTGQIGSLVAEKLNYSSVEKNGYAFLMIPFSFMPSLVDMMVSQLGLPGFIANQISDNADEGTAMVEFCSVVNCSNVSSSRVSPPQNLNKKRIKSGKTPLFEYHVLELSVDAGRGGVSSRRDGNGGVVGPDRVSPRVHLRRGHIRRLHDSGRVVWVNAAVVGAKDRGVVVKDYAVSVKTSAAK
jgi:hypothetical protein